MSLQFHPYVIVLAVSALMTLVAAVIVLLRDVPGSVTLGAVLLNSFIWRTAYGLSWALVGLEEKLLWLKVTYLGVVSIPTLFLVFALRITHNEAWLTPRNLALLCVEPAFILLTVFLNTDWFYSRVSLDRQGVFTVLLIERCEGFWLNAVYSYLLILLAVGVLAFSALRASP